MPLPSSKMVRKISTAGFFFEYKGHPIQDLAAFHQTTSFYRPGTPVVYLAGDSSLDNKYWLPSAGGDDDDEPLPVPVPEIYDLALHPPRPKPDVAFWMNHFLGAGATAINLAVEASLLRQRHGEHLLEHDEFIRDHIRTEDVLIVSVGGNDIAMSPTLSTICHMLLLVWLTPLFCIRNDHLAWLILRHFTSLFKTQTERYIAKLVSKTKPRAVLVCMIYHPLEASAAQSSWADRPLKYLGYDRAPRRLQTAIEKMYELATSRVRVPGVQVVPFPLFGVLDGKEAGDYVERVEPSVEGGQKIAEAFAEVIKPLIR